MNTTTARSRHRRLIRFAFVPCSITLIILLAQQTAAARVNIAPPQSASVIGTALWAGGYSQFNVRAAPRTDATVVEVVQPRARLQILGAVHGAAIGSSDLWYRIQLTGGVGYVHSSGVGYVDSAAPWTGVLLGDRGTVGAIASHTTPASDAVSDGAFALGTRLTVLGLRHGAALEAGNDAWYLVSTGSYRPAYIYAAYLGFERLGAAPVPVPVVGAASALVLDLDSGRVLYSLNPDATRPPASLVKMMTAAVALDRVAPNTLLTVPAGAPSVGVAIGGTAMGLLPGQALSLHDLLYGMFLPSGNDAAYTIANDVAGSQDAFAALMNAKAASLGLTHTHFVQAYGLDAANQYSTARDLLRLARYDLAQYPLVRGIVGTADHIIGAGRTHPAFVLHNTNKLLGVYPGAFGMKTGTTPAAGQNLVAAVGRDGRRVVLAVLGATDRYADATALLNYAIARDLQAA